MLLQTAFIHHCNSRKTRTIVKHEATKKVGTQMKTIAVNAEQQQLLRTTTEVTKKYEPTE